MEERGESDISYVEQVSKHMYTTIFNTSINISFHKPKSDRFDTCEAFNKLVAASTDDTQANVTHVQNKQFCKEERDRDRACHEPTNAILCIDLQNVITLPRSNVSCMFYKRKLTVYNMTGHLSIDKKAFCVIWNEAQAGRAGNDIASAVSRMLDEVMKLHPELKTITIWSDSCIPQNKNSFMSAANLEFMSRHRTLESVTQKYWEPGHSPI